ncbi:MULTISPECIES: ATP-dependent Clp protease proteolytic subunit [unclassified Streptomyces]|uniref:ATP-dependent Clp protease proteolytic subunit n=1 Tax=unclassified Streptomyces TaxID=2593676 RepID=UPI000A20111E|nr:ATP-dependent Clp protease proteolytic subunit [Streptomyces sp. 13-12-16]OSP42758.1 ATP-dependent Clp protease proteolytic subunit [Streptomyces sp. 13-12-16]
MTRPSARHVLPELTERTASGNRTTDPYSKLLEERIVILGTQIDETSANDVMAQFMYLEHHSPDRDVSLYVNSPGGSFHAMSAIYDTLRYVSCDVQTICLGRAEGAAALLLAAGTPGKRLLLPGSRLVLRQPSLLEPVEGQAGDLAIQAEELTRIRSRMEEILVRHTGRTPEQVRADIERDKVLDARAAVEYGLADRIVPDRRSPSPASGAR